MKTVIAPDSYKGALRASKIAELLKEAWLSIRPQDEVVTLPLSDGGEGLCEALVSGCNGQYISIAAHDSLMRPRLTRAGIIGKTAVLESAEANGIELLKNSELAPLHTTTYGVGEMLKYLLCEKKCEKIIVGIGGSATVDGGAGMLQGLGAKFFDRSGKQLPPGIGGGALADIAGYDLSEAENIIGSCEILVACDVTNILCGPQGSAAVFGPQKGATPEMVTLLDRNLEAFARLFEDAGASPGDGAAGGLGFALRKLVKASLRPGADLVMQEIGFADALTDASLVITGEGCSDDQTAYGKLCARVADFARSCGVPTVLVSGALKGECKELEKLFAGCFSISNGPGTLDDAIAATSENLLRTGRALARLAEAFKIR